MSNDSVMLSRMSIADPLQSLDATTSYFQTLSQTLSLPEF